MEAVNRSVVIVRYKPPFIKWANSRMADGIERSREYFEDNRTAVLIPKQDGEKEARVYVEKIWNKLFEEILADWNNLEILWPQNRSKKMFHQWFSIEFQQTVIDVG